MSDDTRGDFKHLLVSQLSGNRDESKNVDKNKAEADAKDILEVYERFTEAVVLKLSISKPQNSLFSNFSDITNTFNDLTGDHEIIYML